MQAIPKCCMIVVDRMENLPVDISFINVRKYEKLQQEEVK